MYRTAQQRQWDYDNAIDYAREEAFEEGQKIGLEIGLKITRQKVVLEMLKSGIAIDVIAACSKLSIEEIEALK
uniref:hypothetical protein n=1 Tax=Pedobacter schmidteae TaxID=2201271 RepID=UPI000EB10A09|nr:hypothetical protein [Pedobacter schmidteae]